MKLPRSINGSPRQRLSRSISAIAPDSSAIIFLRWRSPCSRARFPVRFRGSLRASFVASSASRTRCPPLTIASNSMAVSSFCRRSVSTITGNEPLPIVAPILWSSAIVRPVRIIHSPVRSSASFLSSDTPRTSRSQTLSDSSSRMSGSGIVSDPLRHDALCQRLPIAFQAGSDSPGR